MMLMMRRSQQLRGSELAAAPTSTVARLPPTRESKILARFSLLAEGTSDTRRGVAQPIDYDNSPLLAWK